MILVSAMSIIKFLKDNFSWRAKSLRKHLGPRQEEFSKKLDTAFSTITRCKHGKIVPSRLEINLNESIYNVSKD